MHDPADATGVLAAVEAGFAETPNPGSEFLQGSREGCEPGEAVDPFRDYRDWREVPADVLDANYTALSFFSEGGFRFFLPAYLVADVRGLLRTADPAIQLTGGFSATSVQVTAAGQAFERRTGGPELLNPRRYGAMTFEDYARSRMSVFCREEARAIVAYLRFRLATADLDAVREQIDTALAAYWLDRAERAPGARDLAEHLDRERTWFKAINPE
jgi:hypothetical protein